MLRRFMRHGLCALVVGTVIYFSCMHQRMRGGMLEARRCELERSQAEVVVIGSSICRKGFDPEIFTADNHLTTLKACENGAASAWWYLYVKNVLGKTEHRPKTAIILFRDHFLTDPDFRIGGPYAKQLRALSEANEERLASSSSAWDWVPQEAQAWLQTRLLRRSAGLLRVHRDKHERAPWEVFSEERMHPEWISATQLASEDTKEASALDFDARLRDSYLPEILNCLEARGIQPIFVRMKRRQNLDSCPESPELQNYIVKLENYLDSRHARLIDFSADARIALEHFGPGDHLNRKGQRLFSHCLAEATQGTGHFDFYGSHESH